jgi:hypothetical protein
MVPARYALGRGSNCTRTRTLDGFGKAENEGCVWQVGMDESTKEEDGMEDSEKSDEMEDSSEKGEVGIEGVGVEEVGVEGEKGSCDGVMREKGRILKKVGKDVRKKCESECGECVECVEAIERRAKAIEKRNKCAEEWAKKCVAEKRRRKKEFMEILEEERKMKAELVAEARRICAEDDEEMREKENEESVKRLKWEEFKKMNKVLEEAEKTRLEDQRIFEHDFKQAQKRRST